jgi:hypothetical protein
MSHSVGAQLHAESSIDISLLGRRLDCEGILRDCALKAAIEAALKRFVTAVRAPL